MVRVRVRVRVRARVRVRIRVSARIRGLRMSWSSPWSMYVCSLAYPTLRLRSES